MGRKNDLTRAASGVRGQGSDAYNRSLTPSATESEYLPFSQEMTNRFKTAADRGEQDYSSIMQGYRDFSSNNAAPRVGFNSSDMRSRAVSPIRAAYGNTIRELDRSRSLGGGAANYIAARSRAQRELPGQLSDAMTNVEASIADKQLQADTANQQAELASRGMNLGALNSMSGLYSSTPGAAGLYGGMAQRGYETRLGAESDRRNYGLHALDTQLNALNTEKNVQSKPWWETALGAAGNFAPYIGRAFGGGGFGAGRNPGSADAWGNISAYPTTDQVDYGRGRSA